MADPLDLKLRWFVLFMAMGLLTTVFIIGLIGLSVEAIVEAIEACSA